jgi:hypothetical protein
MLIDAVACPEAGAAGPGGSFAGFAAWEVVPQYPELAGFMKVNDTPAEAAE